MDYAAKQAAEQGRFDTVRFRDSAMKKPRSVARRSGRGEAKQRDASRDERSRLRGSKSMERKIIQIATAVSAWQQADGTDVEAMLYALCDDGTVWYSLGKSPELHKGWCKRPLPQIPQGEATPYEVG